MNEHTRPPVDPAGHGDTPDDIAALLQVAGKRSAVPQERIDRARDNARHEWRRVVNGRSRRRNVAAAVGFAAAAVLALALVARFAPFGAPGSNTPGEAVQVATIVGTGWTESADARRALDSGDTIAVADDVATTVATGSDGRLELELGSGHVVRMDRDTRLRFVSRSTIELERGGIYVDSGFDNDPQVAITVHTPLGVVQEIGTQFEVRLSNGELRVRLREGAAVLSRDGETHEVAAGDELYVDAGGNVRRGSIERDDTAWNWLLDVTGAPSLDGRTARDFLDWAARERGWVLEFEHASVARAAGTTVLGGAADGLTVDEALDAVLPTCRLTWRVEDGALIVGAE